MNKRMRLGFQSALLVSAGAIIIFFTAAIFCWCIGLSDLAVLCMSLSVIGLISRLWGRLALNSISFETKDDATVISAGQSFTTHYSIKNNKLLPLIWIDLCLDIPKNNCISPGSDFSETLFTDIEAEYLGRSSALVRRFAFLGPYSSLEWDTKWTGQRRGIYMPKAPVMRSGDGFGLAQTVKVADDFESKCYVVWPRLIPVNVSGFIQNVFNGCTGKAGYFEDLSVLKNERSYSPRDSWKRIDWRNAARTDELMIKEFETIAPQSFLFILDPSSFDNPEEAISILASVIFELNRRGYRAGVSLPSEYAKPALTIDALSGSLESVMYALSDINTDSISDKYDIESIYLSANAGSRVWLVTDKPDRLAFEEIKEKLKEYSFGIFGGHIGSSLSFEEVRQ